MLDTRLPRRLLVLDGPGWSHPYPAGPWSAVFYKDGGDDQDDDGTDDKTDQNDDADDDQDDDRDGDDQDKDGDDDLGEKGRKALRALRRENRALKSENRTLKGPSDTKKPPAKDSGKGDDPDEIRRQAREEAQAEVWNDRVESAAIAAAAGRLANPQLAARLLDLSDIPKDDKGRPDLTAITELIDELIEDEPYLAAKSATDSGGRRFQGGADSGARKPAKKAAASLGEAIAATLSGKK